MMLVSAMSCCFCALFAAGPFFSLLCFGKISSIVELCIVQEKGLRLSSPKGLCLSQSERQPVALVLSVAV